MEEAVTGYSGVSSMGGFPEGFEEARAITTALSGTVKAAPQNEQSGCMEVPCHSSLPVIFFRGACSQKSEGLFGALLQQRIVTQGLRTKHSLGESTHRERQDPHSSSSSKENMPQHYQL